MDSHLKQWINRKETDERQSAKIPKLLLDPHHLPETAASPLRHFLPHLQMIIPSSSLPDLASSSTRFYRIGSYFSASQLQELELQALIFRYMVTGAAVPDELLQPIKKSLLLAPSYFLHYPHWGRGASMDPEPGRCRRTDGKKWRCSRDVVSGQKYCERHVHRGRNRSRKPVEVPAPDSATSCGFSAVGGGSPCRIGSNPILASQPSNNVATGTHYTLSELSPAADLSSSGPKMEEFGQNCSKSDGHVLRHFFDDWPRSLEKPGSVVHGGNKNQISSSISELGNSPSDISLKLSTGDAEERHPEPQANWSSIPVAQMGGPLAVALQSSSVSSFVGA